MGKYNKKNDLFTKYGALSVIKVADIIKSFLTDNTLIALNLSNNDVLNLAEEVVESGIIEDMIAYAENDPAAKGNYDYVYNVCKGFEAVMYYRIAHAFLVSNIVGGLSREYLCMLARRITEEEKVKTGIDINPACVIGKGCVIDHGIGTRIGYMSEYSGNTNVFGETAIIGDYCIILNDVVIGAGEVNKGQKEGRRHPKIGNNVTICSGARVLGPVIIGDNVFIGTRVIVCQDIPSNCKVTLSNQYQIIKKQFNSCETQIYGIIEGDIDGTLILGGTKLDDVMLSLIDADTYEIIEGSLTVLSNNGKKVVFRVPQYSSNKRKIGLRVVRPDKTEIYFYSKILSGSA